MNLWGEDQSPTPSVESSIELRQQRSAAWKWKSSLAVKHNPSAVSGGVVGLLIIFSSLTAPLIAPCDILITDFNGLTMGAGKQLFGQDFRSHHQQVMEIQ